MATVNALLQQTKQLQATCCYLQVGVQLECTRLPEVDCLH